MQRIRHPLDNPHRRTRRRRRRRRRRNASSRRRCSRIVDRSDAHSSPAAAPADLRFRSRNARDAVRGLRRFGHPRLDGSKEDGDTAPSTADAAPRLLEPAFQSRRGGGHRLPGVYFQVHPEQDAAIHREDVQRAHLGRVRQFHLRDQRVLFAGERNRQSQPHARVPRHAGQEPQEQPARRGPVEGGAERPAPRPDRRGGSSLPRRGRAVFRGAVRRTPAPAGVPLVQIQPGARSQHPGVFSVHDELLHRRTLQHAVRQRAGDGRCHERTHHRRHALGGHAQRRRILHLEQQGVQGSVIDQRSVAHGGQRYLRERVSLREHFHGALRTVHDRVGRAEEHESTVHRGHDAVGAEDGGERRIRDGDGDGSGFRAGDGHLVGQSGYSVRCAVVRHGVLQRHDGAGFPDGGPVDFIYNHLIVDVRGAGEEWIEGADEERGDRDGKIAAGAGVASVGSSVGIRNDQLGCFHGSTQKSRVFNPGEGRSSEEYGRTGTILPDDRAGFLRLSYRGRQGHLPCQPRMHRQFWPRRNGERR
mmetsp:Transcript_30019/g.55235  ORF Transcript_30019/g.55235 Transcript_30019/m.55235 type:complete len:530 (-) Transcript_30019:779-2368(-)